MGGYRPLLKTCTKCNCEFYGVWNRIVCDSCRKTGTYAHTCNGCNVKFYSSAKSNKYCNDCVDNRIWQRGKRDESIGRKISEAKLEFFKSEYGKETAKSVGIKNSVHMRAYMQSDEGKQTRKAVSKKLSLIMRNKIMNGEFTPNITNSWTHWDAYIDLNNGSIKKFRSSWEAIFWLSNSHLSYETIRIPYINSSGVTKVYIADFYDSQTNTIYELKPKCNWLSSNQKMQQIIKYCLEKSIKFIWINEDNLLNYIDSSTIITENQINQYKKVINGITKNKNHINPKDTENRPGV